MLMNVTQSTKEVFANLSRDELEPIREEIQHRLDAVHSQQKQLKEEEERFTELLWVVRELEKNVEMFKRYVCQL